jgi:hypothetical protein
MKGMKLEVYRAHPPRTFALVAAPSTMTDSAGVFVRDIRAADTPQKDVSAVQALRCSARLTCRNVRPISSLADFKKAQQDHAAAQLIENICKGE